VPCRGFRANEKGAPFSAPSFVSLVLPHLHMKSKQAVSASAVTFGFPMDSFVAIGCYSPTLSIGTGSSLPSFAAPEDNSSSVQ
jgi:hypothetical protein